MSFGLKRPWSGFRVGRKVEESLKDVELTPDGAPSSLLFPASHGKGLAFTLLLQFLVSSHNTAVNIVNPESGIHKTFIRDQFYKTVLL